jgi:hypothetical protein
MPKMVVKKRDPYLLIQKPLPTENILTTEGGGDMANSFNFYGTHDTKDKKFSSNQNHNQNKATKYKIVETEDDECENVNQQSKSTLR